MELFVLGHAPDARLFGKSRRGFENAVLNKMGFDVLGHEGGVFGENDLSR
jgi:hypothetical protein